VVNKKSEYIIGLLAGLAGDLGCQDITLAAGVHLGIPRIVGLVHYMGFFRESYVLISIFHREKSNKNLEKILMPLRAKRSNPPKFSEDCHAPHRLRLS
jgi:hypothetical protein